MAENNNILPPKTLTDLYKWLIRQAVSSKMPYEVAQELANDTLLVVCNTFDPDRGNIKAFSARILINKIRNHVRKNTPFTDAFDDEHPIDFENPENILLNQENIMKLKKYFDALRSELDSDELVFFLKFQETLEELETRAVSETSRRLGIDPNAGANIMKRIVRKAKRLKRAKIDYHEIVPASKIEPELRKNAVLKVMAKMNFIPTDSNDISNKQVNASLPPQIDVPADNLLISIAKIDSMLCALSFDNFWNNLSVEQKFRLSSF